jgi:hypothetical protein
MTTHTVQAILYGITCGAGGFMVGRYTRDWSAGMSRREVIGWAVRVTIAFLVIALAVFTYANRERQVSETARSTACNQEYFRAVSQALADRSAASGAASVAELDYLDTLQRDGDVTTARATYIAALQQLEMDRRSSPIPQPPDCR